MLSADSRSAIFQFLRKLPIWQAALLVAAIGSALWVVQQNAEKPIELEIKPLPVNLPPPPTDFDNPGGRDDVDYDVDEPEPPTNPDIPDDGGHGDGQPRRDPPALPIDPPEDADSDGADAGQSTNRRTRQYVRSLYSVVASA